VVCGPLPATQHGVSQLRLYRLSTGCIGQTAIEAMKQRGRRLGSCTQEGESSLQLFVTRPLRTPGRMADRGAAVGRSPTASQHSYEAAAADAARAAEEASALAREFEDLCFEFTSPAQAREYGTDHLKSCDETFVQAALGGESGVNKGQPGQKRGSLRIFAQQVCIEQIHACKLTTSTC
jgi:hypothetical protein